MEENNQTKENEVLEETEEVLDIDSNEKSNIKMEAQVIGDIKEDKQKGVIGLIIIFVLLIGFTFGLPEITKYYKEKTETSKEYNEITESKEQNTIDAEVLPLVYYEIDLNTEFSVDKLKFSGLIKEQTDDYYLRLNVLNRSNKSFEYDEKYYIELYNAEKTLLERVKLISKQSILPNNSLTIDLPINVNSYTNATLITISTKTEIDYQEVNLNTKEEDYEILTCNNGNRNIFYYFKEEKLAKITDIFEYSNTNEQIFDSVLKTYTSQAAKYNNIEGVSSNIVDTNLSFTMNTEIDLSKANLDALNSFYYFNKNTLPKVVKFEMESMRYSCK